MILRNETNNLTINKMKYSIHVLLLIGFILFSNNIPCLAFAENPNHIIDSKDSTNAVKTIRGFLKWYKANYKKSSAFRLVGTDKSGYYFVDKKVCEKYLSHLKSSGYISEHYIKKWREYFSEMEKKFKDNPQNEGPPEGFDYDLISGTQEPELFYSPSEYLKLAIIKVDKYKVVIKTIDIWVHQFTMSKSNGEWKIDDIEILGYPDESNPK